MAFIRTAVVLLALLAAPASLLAADLDCKGTGKVEEFHYAWRLKGGMRLLAGLMFPTNGVGNLRTTYLDRVINSELLITAPNGRAGGFYSYESQMDTAGEKTLMTASGYAWKDKARNERTIFDWAKRLVRIRKQSPGEEAQNRVKPLPEQAELRDVLTAIHYLREHATDIRQPLTTSIYTDGKEYPVVFRPTEHRTFVIDSRKVDAMGFEIVDAPGGRKWSGGIKVWLTNDARRIPARIEIQQSVASLQLDLKSFEGCRS
ncbi:MAG TPA: DUF3108 domain-containing protein [Thermoanaerobaculia bacterium]